MRRPPENESGSERVAARTEPSARSPLVEATNGPDSTASAVAGRIRAQRRLRRWNPDFVAKLAALPPARVRQLERAEGKAGTRAEIARLARALSVSESWLAAGEIAS